MADDDDDFDASACETNAEIEALQAAFLALLTSLDDVAPAIRTLTASTMNENLSRITRLAAENMDDPIYSIRAEAYDALIDRIDPMNVARTG
ncbi:MAG: hypothetical protein ACPGNV_14170 [Mangrovicoccus sp.]